MNTNEEIIFKSNGWQAINRMGIINENYHTLILNNERNCTNSTSPRPFSIVV